MIQVNGNILPVESLNLMSLGLNLTAWQSEMESEVEPVSKFHGTTFTKNVAKVVVKSVEIFFPDGLRLFVRNELFDSVHLVL